MFFGDISIGAEDVAKLQATTSGGVVAKAPATEERNIWGKFADVASGLVSALAPKMPDVAKGVLAQAVDKSLDKQIAAKLPKAPTVTSTVSPVMKWGLPLAIGAVVVGGIFVIGRRKGGGGRSRRRRR